MQEMLDSEGPFLTTKSELRAWAIARRKSLPMAALSEVLVERLCELPELQAARHILMYQAMPDEVDVSGILARQEANYYLPRCAPGRRLAVHRFERGVTPLRTGPFGIQEPDPTQVPEVEPEQLDAVIVPALLLTRAGARLGYGGGYYDRFLPRCRPDCHRIGVLPETLIVANLPTDPWDAWLHCVVRETGFSWVPPR